MVLHDNGDEMEFRVGVREDTERLAAPRDVNADFFTRRCLGISADGCPGTGLVILAWIKNPASCHFRSLSRHPPRRVGKEPAGFRPQDVLP